MFQCANADDLRLQGVFVNTAQTEEPIKSAIEAAVKDFNFVARPIARGRLKRANPFFKRVAIERRGNSLTIVAGASKPTTTEPDHAPIKWTRDDGEVFDVSTVWQGATLIQTFASRDGTRVNRYALSSDGVTLTMQVAVSGPELAKPVQYQLSFRRETTQ
jgi:hypothetical protein